MMNISTAFNFDDKRLRVYGTIDEPWFCGKDVCDILEYKNTSKAISDNVDNEDKLKLGEVITGGYDPKSLNKNDLKMIFINESGLYSLILKSKVEGAKKFKKWVTAEVLPSIRKNGYFVNKNISEEQIEELQQKLQNREKELQIKDEELQIRDNAIKKLEKKQLVLNTLIQNTKPMEKNQVFYIATSKAYAAQNRFKFGGVAAKSDMRNRLNSYNTGRAQNDQMYYCKFFMCHNYKQVESRIGNILERFRDKQNSQKEMLFIAYEPLLQIAELICDHYDDEIDCVNKICQEIFDKLVEGEPTIPEPIELGDSIQIATTRGGVTQTHKINIDDWTDAEFEEALIKILNICAVTKNIEHDFKNGDASVEFAWTDVTQLIKDFYGKKCAMNKWRDVLKKWYKDNKLHKFRIKGVGV